MSGLFSDSSNDRLSGIGPAPPGGATPSAADKLVDAEQQRSEAQRIGSIQRQLRLESSSVNRGYGLRSLFGALGQGRSSLLGSG